MTRKTRNKFSPEFKREAVRLLEESDKGVAQLADRLLSTQSSRSAQSQGLNTQRL